MKQGRHFLDPRLYVEATAAVQDDNCPGIQLRRILDQIILKLRQPEGAITLLTVVLLVAANSENYRTIVSQ